ncbi:MAG: glycoside hydrolase family 9 protein [Chitinophagaceae bacterium]
MRKGLIAFFLLSLMGATNRHAQVDHAWIRINQLGYTPGGVKVAVWCSKEEGEIGNWELVEVTSGKIVESGTAGKGFGAYGPFKQSYRLNFSSFTKPGRYYLQAGGVRSPGFEIGNDVYKGAADFCLRYMRQQRSGFNPYLKDSCHTHDGYVLYGEKVGIKDSTRIDVSGGWHDASDYLQYSATSANATYHLLMAYRDFPKVFYDEKMANGLDGKNGMADVLDEAKWGLDWLLKMHPRPDWMFNQIADDRDHMGMRIPKEDSFYGRGYERPVYFLSGEPQQRGKFMNATTGRTSTAAKFSSAFGLGFEIYETLDSSYAEILAKKASSALAFAQSKSGVTQTASVRSPYIYAEENWSDDLELAEAVLGNAQNKTIRKTVASYLHFQSAAFLRGYNLARVEPVTPWLGTDTAKHYQWYPFINLGHYELAKQLTDKRKDTVIGYYKEGIQRVWNKAQANAFYRGVPFIWCSNNLTTSFAIQCYWYKELTGDNSFKELEQANFDWLFGCNPWGTSMVYGLPSRGDTPVDPHSAFTHLKNYPIDGGLVDGPVYGSIYKSLIGIQLKDADEYAEWQSDLAVYHDDYGDYSTNEPTMDGTASLIYLLAAKESESPLQSPPRGEALKSLKKDFTYSYGGIIRGDSTKKNIALVFTGDEFADGGDFIAETLGEENIKASFFFTGRFYRNSAFRKIIRNLKKEGHYLGPHSDQHLLYCDWNKRDSLLVTKKQFSFDLGDNYTAMAGWGISGKSASFFIPPYEWYNDSIAAWTGELKLQLINFTPGTRSTADYTWPALKNYQSSDIIYNSITGYEHANPGGLNGFILLIHTGTDLRRTDKFYRRLPELLRLLKAKGYQFQRVDELLGH